jgi:glutathione peroxidase
MPPSAPPATADLFAVPVTAIDGTETTLEPYRGRVLLVVNVASRCGGTPQYAGLEALYRANRDRGLVVLGFPCNQFLWQEPGDGAAIREFCSTRYAVTFPLFAKVRVNGPAAHPLYRLLKRQAPGTLGTRAVKWNFTKFLVGRDGTVLRRFGPLAAPSRLRRHVEAALGS